MTDSLNHIIVLMTLQSLGKPSPWGESVWNLHNYVFQPFDHLRVTNI